MRRSRKRKILANILALILLLILVFLTNAKENNSYLKQFTDIITKPIRTVKFNRRNKNIQIENFKNIEEVKKELARLQNENNKLKAEIQTKEILTEDNKRLNELLKLRDRYTQFDTLPVKIKYKSTNNFSDYVLIDAGKNQGLEQNMIVISEAGLYGRIIEVYNEESKVQLITDPSSKISVNVGRNGESIIAQGTMKKEDKLILNLIPSSANISVGDQVVTSGVGGVFPKGIVVGKVTKTKNMSRLSDKLVEVSPNKNLGDVEILLVIKK